MNRRAALLGMTNTRFASPSGLNDRGHSTARDVATMTRWAMASAAFRSLVRTRIHRVRLRRRRVALRNLNDLLWTYPGAVGVKTGFTYRAQWSLVAVARRGRATILGVLLHDRHRPFADGTVLLNYGFQRLRRAAA
jgi:D-alanyl-D-alanine carboxypeptidase (penicillin-binding protein 5/6)